MKLLFVVFFLWVVFCAKHKNNSDSSKSIDTVSISSSARSTGSSKHSSPKIRTFEINWVMNPHDSRSPSNIVQVPLLMGKYMSPKLLLKCSSHFADCHVHSIKKIAKALDCQMMSDFKLEFTIGKYTFFSKEAFNDLDNANNSVGIKGHQICYYQDFLVDCISLSHSSSSKMKLYFIIYIDSLIELLKRFGGGSFTKKSFEKFGKCQKIQEYGLEGRIGALITKKDNLNQMRNSYLGVNSVEQNKRSEPKPLNENLPHEIENLFKSIREEKKTESSKKDVFLSQILEDYNWHGIKEAKKSADQVSITSSLNNEETPNEEQLQEKDQSNYAKKFQKEVQSYGEQDQFHKVVQANYEENEVANDFSESKRISANDIDGFVKDPNSNSQIEGDERDRNQQLSFLDDEKKEQIENLPVDSTCDGFFEPNQSNDLQGKDSFSELQPQIQEETEKNSLVPDEIKKTSSVPDETLPSIIEMNNLMTPDSNMEIEDSTIQNEDEKIVSPNENGDKVNDENGDKVNADENESPKTAALEEQKDASISDEIQEQFGIETAQENQEENYDKNASSGDQKEEDFLDNEAREDNSNLKICNLEETETNFEVLQVHSHDVKSGMHKDGLNDENINKLSNDGTIIENPNESKDGNLNESNHEITAENPSESNVGNLNESNHESKDGNLGESKDEITAGNPDLSNDKESTENLNEANHIASGGNESNSEPNEPNEKSEKADDVISRGTPKESNPHDSSQENVSAIQTNCSKEEKEPGYQINSNPKITTGIPKDQDLIAANSNPVTVQNDANAQKEKKIQNPQTQMKIFQDSNLNKPNSIVPSNTTKGDNNPSRNSDKNHCSSLRERLIPLPRVDSIGESTIQTNSHQAPTSEETYSRLKRFSLWLFWLLGIALLIVFIGQHIYAFFHGLNPRYFS